MRQQNGEADFTLLQRRATSPIFNRLEGFWAYGTVWEGARANLCGGSRPDGSRIQAIARQSAEGNAHGGIAAGLAAKRCGTTQGLRLAETVEAPGSGADSDLPAEGWWRRTGRRRGRRAVLADEGERSWLRVVRSGNRDASGITRQVRPGLRHASEGAAFDPRLPPHAEASGTSANSDARRGGRGESRGNGPDDFRQRASAANGEGPTERCSGADGGNRTASEGIGSARG